MDRLDDIWIYDKMDPTEPITDSKHTSIDKTSWSSRLSQKLKRSSAGGAEHSIASQNTLDQQSVPSTTSKSREYTATTNLDEFPPSRDQDVSNYTATPKTIDTQVTSLIGQASDDDIIGLVVKGKARRKSNASNKQFSPIKSISSHYPSTRNHDPNLGSSMTKRDGGAERGSYEGDRESTATGQTDTNVKSNDPSLIGFTSHSDVAPQYSRSSAIKRKEVPVTRDTTASVDPSRHNGFVLGQDNPYDNAIGIAHGDPETDLPIAAEFTNHPAGIDARSSLDAAREILNQHDNGPQTEPSTHNNISVEETTKNLERLDLTSPEVLSPASFVSANDNYFETKSEAQSKSRPSAEEIVERAKYDSVDTIRHNKMAPAVTHEVIQKRIHEVTEKRITRDIHHYHHVHRILPVHSVEILPAKHYRIVDGVQVEMKPEEVPQSRIDAWESAIIPKIEG